MFISDEDLYSAPPISAPVTAADTGNPLAKAAGALDPWGAAFGAASTVLASAVSTPPAGPSSAVGGSQGGSKVDNSGWNVTFGNNAGIESTRDETAPASLGQALGGMTPYLPYVALAVGAVVIIKRLKRRS